MKPYNNPSAFGIALFTLMTLTSGLPRPASAADDSLPAKSFSGLSGSLNIYDISGGVNSKARGDTIFKRFTDETSVTVRADFNADVTKFFATMESGAQSQWSLIEFGGAADFNRAKNAGYLEKIDPQLVPMEKLEAGSRDEYGIRAMTYAATMIWNSDVFPLSGPQPQTWADFYDTKKFPGKRCMFKYPQAAATLESALLAEGVEPAKLYPLDIDRALKKLDTIKSDIVWWTSGAQSIQYITSGECDIGITWSARTAAAVLDDKAPLAMSWNQALYTTAYWAVPKGAVNAKAGQAAIAMWILDKQGQVDYVTRFPQTTDIVGLTLADYPQNVRTFLPTGDNLKTAIAEDTAFFEKNLPQVNDRFNAWLQ